jgi:predicted AAA+ superfamily ATPase
MDKNINFVSLDDLRTRTLALEDPELFLETYKAPLIIDEFQYAPNLLSYIKIKVDKARMNELFGDKKEVTTMYYLTGSQSFLSMKNVSESLAGRVGIIELNGLSTREINKEKNRLFIPDIDNLKKEKKSIKYDLNTLYERIFKGSFPETYKNNNISLTSYFDSYVKTYIERDIRDLINISDEVKFMKFMVSVAARTGQELNLTEIANDAEISSPTANDWLSILVNTGLVILIEPYTNNIIKRVVKRPKLYFMDTGLACYLTKYPNYEILETSAYSGHIFETYVVSEIVKSFSNFLLNAKRHLYYYRDNNQREIDLIIEYNNKLYPIEIKKSKNPNKSAIKHFEVLKEENKEVSNGVVLCMCEEIFPIDKDNYLVPIEYI